MADPKPDPTPVTVFGIPVRLDGTVCAPGEVWLEAPNGEAVRVWPPPAEEATDPDA